MDTSIPSQTDSHCAELSPLYTPGEVADKLRIKVSAVHRLVRNGKLGSIEVSPKHRRFTQKHIDMFLAAQEQRADDSKSLILAPDNPTSNNPAFSLQSDPNRTNETTKITGQAGGARTHHRQKREARTRIDPPEHNDTTTDLQAIREEMSKW